ncbi:MAG: methionyl-tRNA formyltransferase [Chloroflexia bacterium]|nr:methionyl-tRNA formyltransferase [Chloroflexia bacterium]
MRIIFFGTPDFAVPALDRFISSPEYDVALVVTQPDRPAGRGRSLQRSPVALHANKRGIDLYQPKSLNREARFNLAGYDADLFFVAAYGRIFGPKTLALPRSGCVNLHASVLPKYRGASPITAAILTGDAITGVSLMMMDARLDTGALIAAADEAIRGDDTTATLGERLSEIGADLAVSILPKFVAGTIEPRPQSGEEASLTRLLTKGDGWLDWTASRTELERRVRAMQPWPRAWTTLREENIQIHRATPGGELASGKPGQIVAVRPALVVATGAGSLQLDEVQAAGSRRMSGAAFATGRRLTIGDTFDTANPPLSRSALVVAVDSMTAGDSA